MVVGRRKMGMRKSPENVAVHVPPHHLHLLPLLASVAVAVTVRKVLEVVERLLLRMTMKRRNKMGEG
jgi:hypothetical protein